MRSSSRISPLVPLGLVSAGLVSVIAGSFASAPLVADEEWMLFWEYQEISENPSKAFADLYTYNLGEPSVFGRLRILFPITEFFGGFATNQLQKLLGIDPMSAYGLWRVGAAIMLALTFTAVVHGFARSFLPMDKHKMIALAAVVLPVQILSISTLSAFRIFPSHYTLMGILSLVLFYASWRALIFAERRQTLTSKISAALLILLLTLTLVTGSEFFYVLGPVLVAARVLWFKLVEGKNLRTGWKSLWPLAVFTGSFLAIFITIRLWLGGLCRLAESCYSRTRLELDSNLAGDALFRAFGRLPGVSQSAWLAQIAKFENLIEISLLLALIGVVAIFFLRAGRAKDGKWKNTKDLNAAGFFFMGTGSTWLISSSIAVASTSGFSSGGAELGYASFDLVQLTIGASFFLLGSFLILASFNLKSLKKRNFRAGIRVLMVFSGIALLTTMGSASMVANQTASAEISATEETFLQREMSIRSGIAPSRLNSNDIRCTLVKQKHELFPRWLGHDQAVYVGLNNRYLERFGENFCATKVEVFFSDY